MADSAWELSDHVATLQAGEITGYIDLHDPATELRIIAPRNESSRGDSSGSDSSQRAESVSARLFQVLLKQLDTPGPASDYFVRGADLVATYPETTDRHHRIQIYWRVVDRATLNSATLLAIDLIMSVQTSQLDSDPTLTIASELTAREVLRLDNSRPARFTNCLIGGKRLHFNPSEGPGCFLFRDGGSRSYVEMIHPSDFHQARLDQAKAFPDASRLAHQMFHRTLEKGVILRSRLRGIWVPRGQDEELAAAEYRQFAEQEPPLTA